MGLSAGGNAGFHPSGAARYENFGNGLQQQTTLDTRLRPSVATLAGSQTLLSRTYTYQANGNVSRIADGLVTGRSQNFTYDALNRITSASTDATTGTDAWSQTFNLDPWGNLQQSGSMSFTVPANTKNQIYDAAHPTWYTHDAAGNMTGYYNGSSTQNYTWDAEEHMKTAGGYTYTYDANGMRVRKRQDASPNAWTEYLYFGSNVLAERDQAGTWTDYIFAGGKRIAKAPASAATSGTEYYHGDHLGSARLMTNASGNQTWSATYLPFGQEWNPTSTTNHYKFTGKEKDAESGLDYFGARFNSSRMGRFISSDPGNAGAAQEDPQSWNAYSYAGNNPLTFTDPEGLAKTVCKNDSNGKETCYWEGEYNGEYDKSQGLYWNAKTGEWQKNNPAPPKMDDGAVNPGFLGPFDIFFIRVPNLGIMSKLSSLFGRTAGKTAIAGVEKAVISGAEAALKTEVEGILTKAGSKVGNQSIRVSSREAAEQAAKEWVGQGARPIVERSTGAQVGWKSADGMKVARFTSANKAAPYVNLVNKSTGGNLHVRF